MDSGRTVDFNVQKHPHLDHGYAMTSHSAQGQTAGRVLVHVDTDKGAQLVNHRMAYVAISRGSHDVRIFTNDKTALGPQLARDVTHTSAIGKAATQAVGKAIEAPSTATVAGAVVTTSAKVALAVASKLKAAMEQGHEPT
jgi:ATP-dependent exoDNAse (exonuclease V) alpha subunit